MSVHTTFPEGFFDRYLTGPCNNPACAHPWCWKQRLELREFGEKVMVRTIKSQKRKRMARK